jgi:molybdopterin converting factor subunit 1
VTINIRLFASLREIAGSGQITLEVSSKEGANMVATVGDLMKKIAKVYPAFLSQKIPISIALNGKLANYNSILKDRDEVALLPPVSGG